MIEYSIKTEFALHVLISSKLSSYYLPSIQFVKVFSPQPQYTHNSALLGICYTIQGIIS